jgi:hypothetical protein
MSTSDIYLLFGKSARHWSEHRNGWGSAPLCWDYLGEKYIPGYNPLRWSEVWPLNADDRLSQAEKVALLFTLDDAYVPLRDVPQVADWFTEFADLTEADPKFSNRANHWRAFAESLRRAASVKDKRLRGVCVSCTSVNDTWSMRRPDDFEKAWPITCDTAPESTQ